MTEVEIYLNVDTKHRFTETEDAEREFALWYFSDKTGKSAAEEAFHISNAPADLLTDKQKRIKQLWKGRSLSVGDIVSVIEHSDNRMVTHEQYLCRSCGWKQI